MPRYDDQLPLEQAIAVVFPRVDVAGIRRLLDGARDSNGVVLGERVQLAAVLLSAGDLGRLAHYLEQAGQDYRDVLYWAFYYDDEPPARLRKLCKP
jgi:hypothetical protein